MQPNIRSANFRLTKRKFRFAQVQGIVSKKGKKLDQVESRHLDGKGASSSSWQGDINPVGNAAMAARSRREIADLGPDARSGHDEDGRETERERKRERAE